MGLLVFLFYFAIVILILWGILWVNSKIKFARVNREFLSVFRGEKIETPRLKFGSTYSWPTFEITFASKEDLDYATKCGLIDTYKNKIRNRYGPDFDVDRAFYAKFKGQKSF